VDDEPKAGQQVNTEGGTAFTDSNNTFASAGGSQNFGGQNFDLRGSQIEVGSTYRVDNRQVTANYHSKVSKDAIGPLVQQIEDNTAKGKWSELIKAGKSLRAQSGRDPRAAEALFTGHFNLGLQLYAAQQYQKAREQFTFALAENKTDLRCQFIIACCNYQLADTDKAIRKLRELLRKKPKWAAAYYYLALCYRQKADDGNPNSDVFLAVGRPLAAKAAFDNYSLAVENFKQALQYDIAATAECYYQCGLCHRQLGDVAAIADFQQAILWAAANPEYHAALGKEYYRRDKVQEAIKCYLEAIRLVPATRYSCELGIIYMRGQFYNEAIKLLQTALAKQQDDKVSNQLQDALMQRARQHYRHKRYSNAVVDLRQIVDINPSNAAAWQLGGEVLMAQGDYEEAVYCYTRVLEVHFDHHSSYRQLAHCHWNLGQYDAAEQSIHAAVQLEPNDLEYRQTEWSIADCRNRRDRGLEYYNNQQYKKAVEELSRALELNKQNRDCYNLRGLAHEAWAEQCAEPRKMKERQEHIQLAIADYKQAGTATSRLETS